MHFETKTIHAGVHPDPSTGAIMTPIYQTSTYVQEGPGNHKGYEYARTQNPTRTALQDNIAALENGSSASCFGSGLAAMDAVIKLLRSGDHVLASNDMYGGSFRLLDKIFKNFGIQTDLVAMHNVQAVQSGIQSHTKLIWIETPTNPLLNIVDIEAICAIAKQRNILVCVDNTFATPYLQNPLNLGADLVLHSATKYLGGHSDAVHGIVISKNQELGDRLRFIQNASGAVPGPMDCFLILRGIKSLHVRVQRACENAERIAEFLIKHPKVNRVMYPGLTNHPGHALAKKQMKMFGAMLSFDLKDESIEAANTVLASTKLFSCAESLGGVESLIGHPSSMTHASLPKEERLKTGLTDSLIRLSVGIEHVDDLIEDLRIALDK